MDILIYVIVAIIVLLILYVLIIYNTLIKYDNRVEESYSTMDVYLKQRWDLIPNIVSTVKGYAKHEKETLERVIKLRNAIYDNMSPKDKSNVNNEIEMNLPKLIAVSENYPELKSSENFSKLHESLEKVEEDIANSRKYYNACVREYNNKIEMFPSNIIAGMFKFKQKEMFSIKENAKENIKVN